MLARPKLGIEPVRREAFLAILQFEEHGTAPPDEDDVMFLEVALQTTARTLVG